MTPNAKGDLNMTPDVVAETGLKWHDDGQPAVFQVNIMYKVAIVLLVLLLFLYPCALRAQTTNASITGRVTDPSKATIADAKIAAINLGTNFRYESATNGADEILQKKHMDGWKHMKEAKNMPTVYWQIIRTRPMLTSPLA